MTSKKIKTKYFSEPFRNLYFGYIFSCIGDRLWTFAIIFILERLGGIRLVSVNQLIEGISAMIIATYVGNWLDRHNRRFGALTILAINNICVACSSAFLIVCLSLRYKAEKRQFELNASSLDVENTWLYTLSLVLSIIFCAISKCASEGLKLAFTKDWIVVMSNLEKSGTLSAQNAFMTTIDQTSSIIAPIVTGYILFFGGYRFACILFILWNIISWIVERYFLMKVYNQVKELAVRHKISEQNKNELRDEFNVFLDHSTQNCYHQNNITRNIESKECNQLLNNESTNFSKKEAINKNLNDCKLLTHDNRSFDKKKENLLTTIFTIWRQLIRALIAYRRQRVFPAAFALSLLYMTVLGFDGLAISFGKAQNVPDNILGIFRSIGSILGIFGAFSYTLTEQKIGVSKTGLLGLILQQIFLWFCIISIWLPGSPFDPRNYIESWTFDNWIQSSISAFSGEYLANPSSFNNLTINSLNNSTINNITIDNPDLITKVFQNSSINTDEIIDWKNFTINGRSIISILVFFCGITFARLGLWMADLSITQIMQESIIEEERNTVFGTQNAFCQLFSVLKDIIVFMLPDNRTFGILIIISMCSIISGFFLYIYYYLKINLDEAKSN